MPERGRHASGSSSSASSTSGPPSSSLTEAPESTTRRPPLNIAALVEAVAATPGQRILNSADPDAPSALEISRTIARELDHVWDEILLDAEADETLGRHPWDAPHPIVLDMSAAAELGYRPVGDYATTVSDEVAWLVSAARKGEAAEKLPGLDDDYFGPLLDYAAEDRYLAATSKGV